MDFEQSEEYADLRWQLGFQDNTVSAEEALVILDQEPCPICDLFHGGADCFRWGDS